MSDANRDSRMATLQAQAQALRKEMDAPYRKILALLDATLRKLFADEAERFVECRPDLITKLGGAGLRQVHEELAGLAARIPGMLEKVATDSNVWVHLGPSPLANAEQAYDAPRDDLPHVIGSAIRPVASELGKLMLKKGFSPAGTGLQHWSTSADPRMGIEYRGPFPMSADLKSAVASYSKLHVDLIKVERELSRLNNEKVREDALTAWRKAKPES